MVSPPPRDATALLAAWNEGDRSALDQLVPMVYVELRRQAERQMRHQPGGHTLSPTGLVHEAYLRLAGHQAAPWQGRAHFFRVAGRVMRTVLVDHARARGAAKRGGAAVCVTLGAAAGVTDTAGDVDVLALDEALDRLVAFDPDKCRLVELRYFAGLTIEETAEALGVSPATVKREWTAARAWLKREIGGA
jgi:RNA polymerase sigma factor (TIGR02999 family)